MVRRWDARTPSQRKKRRSCRYINMHAFTYDKLIEIMNIVTCFIDHIWTQLRTVIAENLPDDHSHQKIEKMFNVVGRWEHFFFSLINLVSIYKISIWVLTEYAFMWLIFSIKAIRICQPQEHNSSRSAKGDIVFSNKVRWFGYTYVVLLQESSNFFPLLLLCSHLIYSPVFALFCYEAPCSGWVWEPRNSWESGTLMPSWS